MDDEQVRNEVASIYGAGHETTALAGRTPTLADLPNLPYTLMVSEETMRLFPPVPFTARSPKTPS